MPTRPPAHKYRQPRRKAEDRPSPSKRGYDRRWRRLRMTIYQRDGGQCRECQRVVGKAREWHVDHITPKSQGGSDDPSNLQVLCDACHGRKTRREDRDIVHKVKP